jgi:peptide deformylase
VLFRSLLKDANDMVIICQIPIGLASGGKALAHTQINDKDPLNFFVLAGGMAIINPEVVNHTEALVERDEGCLTHPFKPSKTMKRYNKVTVKFRTLCGPGPGGLPELTDIKEDNLNGEIANIFEHEIAHLNGHCIYDEGAKPSDCLKDNKE